MNFKFEYIDDLPKKFNGINDCLIEVISDLTDSWDSTALYPKVYKLKSQYDELQYSIKAFFVEIRLNILLLDEKEKVNYKNYCQISFKLLKEPIDPIKVEQLLNASFGETALTFDETYFNADITVSRDIGFYEASNYVFCYSMLSTYYYLLLEKIINNIHSASINDSDLVSLDSKKNTITQKTLVLYYLIKGKKLNLTAISQDTTKQAKIFSFLFDNSYENLRKAFGNIQESMSGKLKVADNMLKVSSLFEDLGSEFNEINALINKDMGLK